MSQPGFYTASLRVWQEREYVWIERIEGSPRMMMSIERTDATQLAEMLLRLVHAGKFTADAQVRSTEE